MISPCATESFSSTRTRTMRPETISGATLTMCDSTNPSSVMECVRRSMIQGIRRIKPTATGTTKITIVVSRLSHEVFWRGTAGGGGEGDGWGAGAWLMRCLYVGPLLRHVADP